MSAKEGKHNNVIVIAGIFVLSFVVLVMVTPQEEQGETSMALVDDVAVRARKLVDQHLQEVDGMTGIRSRDSEVTNIKMAPPLADLRPSDWQVKNRLFGVSQNQDSVYASVLSDLGVDSPQAEQSEGIEEQLRKDIDRKQWLKRYQVAVEQAYVQSFLENAREAGWEIRLNDEHEVVGVKPITKGLPTLFSSDYR